MQFRTFDIDGVMEVIPDRYLDERGYFSEIYRADFFRENVTHLEFVQENQSLSVRTGTIRGIHFQTPPVAQGKFVRCVAGEIYDVVVDLRSDSPTYGRWLSVILSADSCNQLWIPPGFGHAFCTLKPSSVISYRVTSYYSPEHDKGVAWNDPHIAVEWPTVADPDTLSAKDRQQPRLVDLPPYFSLDRRCA